MAVRFGDVPVPEHDQFERPTSAALLPCQRRVHVLTGCVARGGGGAARAGAGPVAGAGEENPGQQDNVEQDGTLQ